MDVMLHIIPSSGQRRGGGGGVLVATYTVLVFTYSAAVVCMDFSASARSICVVTTARYSRVTTALGAHITVSGIGGELGEGLEVEKERLLVEERRR